MTFAGDLAEFITAVKAIGTHDRTFTGGGRGGDLKNHDDWMGICLSQSRGLLDVRRLTRMWPRSGSCPATPPT
jgi:hypothetical protein